MDERKYVDAVEQDLQQRKADFHKKVADVRQVLVELNLDGGVLSYAHNFAWLTGGGRSFINMATEGGVGSLYVDASQVVLITNEIEGHRLINEEFNGLQGEIKLHEYPWYASHNAIEVAKQLAKSDRVEVDTTSTAFADRINVLRATLTEHEISLFRSLGKDCGRIIGEVARSVRPSMTEWEVAAQLSEKSWVVGITPIVVLIAADERIDAIRHPLPTNKRVKNKVMLVLCGRRAGFVLSVTRMVYITTTPNATVPTDLLRRHDAATYVDAVVIAKTVPGAVASDLFKAIQDAYREKGFDGEWKLHHQGGCAGYQSREWIANPALQCVVGANQAFAWNPSVTGTKSEDTVLIQATAAGKVTHEVLSESPDWPLIKHTVDGVTVARPGILHLAF
uniref:Peptidase M24 domain-containing protein n=1 Tax=Globisporangium ultimum (strain ATCC 200006 / CBS 805.95 / DAOM BR144) TaxID=431595 RepID=K3WD78_GLOUD